MFAVEGSMEYRMFKIKSNVTRRESDDLQHLIPFQAHPELVVVITNLRYPKITIKPSGRTTNLFCTKGSTG